MWVRIASWLLRRRIAVLVVLGVLTAFFTWQGFQVGLSYEFGKHIPASDPDYQAYARFKEKFGEDGNIVVVGLQTDRLFSQPIFAGWHQLADGIDSIEGVNDVVSISRLYSLQRNDSLTRFDVVPLSKLAPKTQAETDSLKKQILAQELYKGLLYNPTTNTTLMAISLDKNVVASSDRIAVVAGIQEKAEAFAAANEVDVHFSGLPFIRTVFSRKVAGELRLFSLLSILISAVFLWVFFRSPRAVIFPILIVVVAVAWCFGIMNLLGYKITLLTGILPPLIVIIGIENCIYLLNRYHDEFSKHGNRARALSRTVEKLGLAAFFTNASTAVSFGVFTFSGSSLLEEFGAVAFLSVMALYLLTIVLVPVVFSLVPPPNPKQIRHLDSPIINAIVDRLVHWVTAYRPVIFASALVLMGFAMWGATKIQAVGYIVDDIPKRDAISQDLHFFEQNFRGIMPFEIVIDTRKRNGVLTSATLRRIERMQDSLAKYPELSQPISVVQGLKAVTQAFYNGDPEGFRMPTSNEQRYIYEYIIGSESGSGAGGSRLLRSMLDSNRAVTRVTYSVADVGTKRMKKIIAGVQPTLDSIFPKDQYKVDVTGTARIFNKGNQYIIDGLIESVVLAFFLIGLISAILFRRVKLIIISLLPNLIPLLITAGIMGFSDIALKPSTVLIYSIAFGIAVDFGIYYLMRYKQELERHRWDTARTVIKALRGTAPSMIYNGIVLFFGFGIFALSSFGGTQSMGILISLTILVAMLVNLLVLPSLIMLFERRNILEYAAKLKSEGIPKDTKMPVKKAEKLPV
jgi:hypothetical protein